MFRTSAAYVALLAFASLATADPGPTLATVFPIGIKAGETVEVTAVGTGFDGDEKLLFSNPGLKAELIPGAAPPPPKKGNQPGQLPPTSAKFKVTAPKDSGSGIFDVRLVCKGGLTNPRAFVVGTMNEMNEKEPNSDVAEAQTLPVDSVANGTIGTNTDVDYFLVKAKAKQNLVVHCLTTTLDSKMQAELMVIAPDGKTIAANRGYRNGDAVLDFLAPAEGDYLVRVSQFAYTTGGPDHFYRLTVTTSPWVDAVYPPLTIVPSQSEWMLLAKNGKPSMPASQAGVLRSLPPTAGMLDIKERFAGTDGNVFLSAQSHVILDNEKNHTQDTSQPITVPCDVAGRIEKKSARHWYSFTAKKGDVWTLEVFADRIGSPVDAFFQLTDEKGKLIVEQDDGPDTLSPNQFYTKSDDPGRYRFTVPADGTYKVMVSTREAAAQFGVRDQYVLRIAKLKPDFRLAVMPTGTHYQDAGTVPKSGSTVFNVYVWRFDGFDGPISLSATNLPKGLSCPAQVIGAGQARGSLVLSAAPDAADWAGFVSVLGTATINGEKFESEARPFSVVWPIQGINSGQPAPNNPVITRMDRGEGLTVAIRGDAPFTLSIVEKGPINVAANGKVTVTVKVKRNAMFKDAVQVYASNGFGPRQQGGQPAPSIGAIPADKDEVKLTIDLPQNASAGSHSLVLRGIAATAAPKGGNNNARVPMSYPALPVEVEVAGRK
jgi:hypothetical protein